MATHADAEQLALLQYMVPGSTVDDIVSSRRSSRRRAAAQRAAGEVTSMTTHYDVVEGKGKQQTVTVVTAAPAAVLADNNSSSASGTALHHHHDDDDDEDDDVAQTGGANTQRAATSLLKCQPAQHTHSDAKVLRRIRVDEPYRPSRTAHADEDVYDEEDDSDVGGSDDDDGGVAGYVCGGSGAVCGAGGCGGGGGGGAARANQRVLNELRELTFSAGSSAGQTHRRLDRSERATTENVMDPRTRLLLYKLVNTGLLREINGCVSTGKEANVYYAVCGDDSAAAVKVFKTSILVFRDRDAYVAGEFRFQRYCKTNPRKMICTWAEKEARNLMRLQSGGVLAPAVKLLRQHVLVMEFIGEDGWPAPRLKEVRFPSSARLDHCYLDLCCTMRKMFVRCRLIHGDLSEYNLLLFRGRVVVIDVSQSVEGDHPRAMDFLRRDIVNVHAFFRSRGHGEHLLSHQDLFQFITSTTTTEKKAAASSSSVVKNKTRGGGGKQHKKAAVGADAATTTSNVTAGANDGTTEDTNDDEEQQWMAQLLELRERRRVARTQACDADAEQAAVDEQVFLRIHVPRTLKEIADDKAPNAEVAPFVHDMTAPATTATRADAAEVDVASCAHSDEDEEDEEQSEHSDDDGGEHAEKNAAAVAVLSDMTRDERKAHKKAVKEANRERRVQKKLQKAAHKKHR